MFSEPGYFFRGVFFAASGRSCLGRGGLVTDELELEASDMAVVRDDCGDARKIDVPARFISDIY